MNDNSGYSNNSNNSTPRVYHKKLVDYSTRRADTKRLVDYSTRRAATTDDLPITMTPSLESALLASRRASLVSQRPSSTYSSRHVGAPGSPTTSRATPASPLSPHSQSRRSSSGSGSSRRRRTSLEFLAKSVSALPNRSSHGASSPGSGTGMVKTAMDSSATFTRAKPPPRRRSIACYHSEKSSTSLRRTTSLQPKRERKQCAPHYTKPEDEEQSFTLPQLPEASSHSYNQFHDSLSTLGTGSNHFLASSSGGVLANTDSLNSGSNTLNSTVYSSTGNNKPARESNPAAATTTKGPKAGLTQASILERRNKMNWLANNASKRNLKKASSKPELLCKVVKVIYPKGKEPAGLANIPEDEDMMVMDESNRLPPRSKSSEEAATQHAKEEEERSSGSRLPPRSRSETDAGKRRQKKSHTSGADADAGDRSSPSNANHHHQQQQEQEQPLEINWSLRTLSGQQPKVAASSTRRSTTSFVAGSQIRTYNVVH